MTRYFNIQSLLFCILLIFLSGCTTVGQLDDFKQWAEKGEYSEIVKQEVDCTEQNKVCGQLILIHGMACYQVAKQNTDAKANYQCAIRDLQRGLDLSKQADKPKEDMKPYAQALLESIRERQDLSANWNESAPYTELLRTQSAQYQETYPTAPEGYYYGSTAAFTEANKLIIQNTAPTTACDLLNQAKTLVERGRQNPGQYAANFEQTGRQINRTLQRECR